jgi:Leucine-rich repeat (LRR) protein
MMRGYLNYHIAKWLLVVILLITTLVLPACACPATPQPATTISPTTITPPTTTLVPVTFLDINLETVIREAIGKPGGPVYMSDLESLTMLEAPGRGISDISTLANLTNLGYLVLGNNDISDISPLAGLTNLELLSLWYNNISDISALVDNAGLSGGDTVNLMDNPLSAESINNYIPQLEARGVTVDY